MDPPAGQPLVMYGSRAEEEVLDWSWVDERLATSGSYWTIAAGGDVVHPRPVWGVWADHTLHLSIGSPKVRAGLELDDRVTVHLPSDTEVVIVEGGVVGSTTDAALVRAYDEKYDWSYDADVYGALTSVRPSKVMAWRSAGWAGREGFQATGRWTFEA